MMNTLPENLYHASKQKFSVGDFLRIRNAVSTEKNANGQICPAIFATSVFSYALQYHIFPHIHADKFYNDYKLNGLYILTQKPDGKISDRTFIAYSPKPISYIYKVSPNNFTPRRIHEHIVGVRDEYVNFSDTQILDRIDITPDVIKADGVNVYVPKNVFARALIQFIFGRRAVITNQSNKMLLKLTKSY